MTLFREAPLGSVDGEESSGSGPCHLIQLKSLSSSAVDGPKVTAFISRVSEEEDAFFHMMLIACSDAPYVGQYVSFSVVRGIYVEEGLFKEEKREEEDGEEVEREMGKVKTYSEEKAFAFLARCFNKRGFS